MKTLEEKIDLFKLHRAEYSAKAAPALVKCEGAVYLAIEGIGGPGGEAFSDAVGALYGVAFTVKMRRKFDSGLDYAIGKLEALWPCDIFNTPKSEWRWRLMIRTPEFVAKAEIAEAAGLQITRGKSPLVRKVELYRLTEGQCVQALHTGPYDTECDTVAKMEAFARKKGMRLRGEHHEIYLSDPRRVAPEKLRTILRHPVEKA